MEMRFLFMFFLTVLFTILATTSSGMKLYRQQITLENHMTKPVVVVYAYGPQWLSNVIKSKEEEGDLKGDYSEAIPTHGNSEIHVWWKQKNSYGHLQLKNFEFIASLKGLGLTDLVVELHSDSLKYKGKTVEYRSDKVQYVADDDINKFCSGHGLKVEEMKNGLLHGKATKG